MAPFAPIKHHNLLKSFFITFPKSGTVSKQSFYDCISSKFGVEKAIAVTEPHKDGTPHIHLAVTLQEKRTKSQVLSYIKTQYPDDYARIDVQSLRSFPESIRYLTSPEKDKIVDTHPLLINCDIAANNQSRIHDIILREIKDMKNPGQLYEICTCLECQQSWRNSLRLELLAERRRLDEPEF